MSAVTSPSQQTSAGAFTLFRDAIDAVVDTATVSTPLVLLTIVVVAFTITRMSGFVVRQVVRRLARRSLSSPVGLWRTRTRNADTESPAVGEQRRRQRVDAASRMINHLVAVLVWIGATIVAFHALSIDAAFFLSSAGFIGAGLAIGGQHKVNDYLTGLSVHFEDRYGVGDEVVADVGWAQPVHAVIDHVGLFSTRLRDTTSTLHFPNGAMAQIRNLSQEAATTTLRLRLPADRDAHEAATALRRLAGEPGLTDLVFVGDIESFEPESGEVELDVRTLRPLNIRSREDLVVRAEAAMAEA